MLPVVLLTIALAQEAAPAQRPAGRANRADALTNGELVNMLDTYAIVQAQNALQLTDEQYGQFVSRLKRLQQVRRRNLQARNRIVQDLRRLSADASADEASLRASLKALQTHDASSGEELRAAYAALDEVLDVRQQARFRIFEERMERQKLDLLMRARARAGANAPPR